MAPESSALMKSQTLVATSSWVCCSIGMTVFNKLAVTALPAACSLVVVQLAATVVIMIMCFPRSVFRVGSFADAMRWCRIVPLFVGVLVTSMLALKNAPMSLVITFRGLAPIFALIGEYFFFPTPYRVTTETLISLTLLLFGITLFVTHVEMTSGNLMGVMFTLLNNLFVVMDKLMQRLMLARDQCPCDISKECATMLQNLLSIPVLAVLVFVFHEEQGLPEELRHLDHFALFWILASCIVGCGISYTGVWTQSLISATSFLVLATANKFGIILLDVFVLRAKTISMPQAIGAFITIAGGVAYGLAREAAERQQVEEEKFPKYEQAFEHESAMLLPKSGKSQV